MLLHWIWYSLCPMTDWAKNKLLQHYADPEEIFFAQDLDSLEELTPEGRAALQNRDLKEAEAILQTCREKEIHILTLQDAAYPARLRHIPDPPMVLYYKGMLPDLDSTAAIGVVGTRKASAYGLQTAREMGRDIGRCGGIVVSGLAYGIDGMAMSGALMSGQSVIGVLGCGIDIVYPRSNGALFADTQRYGCILSEFPPGTQPARWNFPRRNRIISGLCNGVLVIEAPVKSGALITARLALEQGRDVFVVPGNIHVATCEGSNQLMREGAAPVSCGWDILCEYESLFPDKIRNVPAEQTAPFRPLKHLNSAPNTLDKTGENRAEMKKENNLKKEIDKKGIDKEQSAPYSDVNDILPKLSPQERIIVTALKDGPRLVDDVIAETGLTTGKVLGILTMLELKKVIRRHPGKRISLI